MHNIPLKPLYMFTIIGLNKKEKKKNSIQNTYTRSIINTFNNLFNKKLKCSNL